MVNTRSKRRSGRLSIKSKARAKATASETSAEVKRGRSTVAQTKRSPQRRGSSANKSPKAAAKRGASTPAKAKGASTPVTAKRGASTPATAKTPQRSPCTIRKKSSASRRSLPTRANRKNETNFKHDVTIASGDENVPFAVLKARGGSTSGTNDGNKRGTLILMLVGQELVDRIDSKSKQVDPTKGDVTRGGCDDSNDASIEPMASMTLASSFKTERISASDGLADDASKPVDSLGPQVEPKDSTEPKASTSPSKKVDSMKGAHDATQEVQACTPHPKLPEGPPPSHGIDTIGSGLVHRYGVSPVTSEVPLSPLILNLERKKSSLFLQYY
jgi:hypothetical protein